MVNILAHLHQYIPTLCREEKVALYGTEEQVSMLVDDFHQTLLGGDQLTVARIRGAQWIRASSESATERLEGFIRWSKIGMLSNALSV